MQYYLARVTHFSTFAFGIVSQLYVLKPESSSSSSSSSFKPGFEPIVKPSFPSSITSSVTASGNRNAPTEEMLFSIEELDNISRESTPVDSGDKDEMLFSIDEVKLLSRKSTPMESPDDELLFSMESDVMSCLINLITYGV